MRLPKKSILVLGFVLSACSDDGDVVTRPSTTSAVLTPTTATLGPPQPTVAPAKVDPLQVVGTWLVSEAESAAVFARTDRVEFVGDGSFTVTSQAGPRSGVWRIRDGLELMLDGTRYGYVTVAEPRQLRLGLGSGAGMTLVRG